MCPDEFGLMSSFFEVEKMFGYYGEPYWVYRRPRYYYPRRMFVDRYLAEVERALGDLFASEEEAESKECGGKGDERGSTKPGTKSETKSEEKGEVKSEGKTEEKSTGEVEVGKKVRASPRQSYFYQSRSTYDGRDYVEEHRERVTDADGEHTTLRRRLGDRWYETETHTDKDGKSTSKETWHNVPEDHIEAFKQEWESKHGEKYGSVKDESSTPAIETKPEGEKKSESQ